MGVIREATERPLLRARGPVLWRGLRQWQWSSRCAPDAHPCHFLYTCPDTHTCAPFPSSRLRKKTLDQGSFHTVHWRTGDMRKHGSQKPAFLLSPLWELVVSDTPGWESGLKPHDQREMEVDPKKPSMYKASANHMVLGESHRAIFSAGLFESGFPLHSQSHFLFKS